MIASGQMPRSPVWLRKIPSTVSGSQGSRRGFPPAVRFAFPLGARLNITLRARPCQELFSESFSRPSRGPRGAPPSGLLPFAAASSVLYAPPARRGRETRPHTGCRQLQRGGAEGRAASVGALSRPACEAAPQSRRFAPVHRHNRPGCPALAPRPAFITAPGSGACATRPSGADGLAAPPFGRLYKREEHWREKLGPAFGGGRPLLPKRETAVSGSRPPSAQAFSATTPGRSPLRQVVSAYFNIDAVWVRPSISDAKAFPPHSVPRCMPKRRGLVPITKKEESR